MSLILGAIAAGLLIALVVMSTAVDHSWRLRAKDYQSRRRHIIDQLEVQSARLDKLTSSNHFHGNGDSLIRDLEKVVASFELVVTAFARLPAFGTDPGLLDSAEFLTRDCATRMTELEVRCGLRQRAVLTRVASLIRSGMRRGKQAPGPGRGCYFCSRPFHLDLENFAQVKVKIEGSTREVFSCGPCKDSLEETKKIKVLYFLSEGQPTHWSQVPGYVPSEEYWNLNRSLPKPSRNLRLVTTEFDL